MEILRENTKKRRVILTTFSLENLWRDLKRRQKLSTVEEFVAVLQIAVLKGRSTTITNSIPWLDLPYKKGLKAFDCLTKNELRSINDIVSQPKRKLIDDLNYFYEFNILKKEKKKKLGIFYTAIPYCLNLMDQLKANLENNPIVDPFMGTGNFLVAAALKHRISESKIFGMDIDFAAVMFARLNVSIALESNESGFKKIQKNLIVANSLFPNQSEQRLIKKIAAEKPCVVTNPPYGFAVPNDARHIKSLNCSVPDKEVFFFAIAKCMEIFDSSNFQTFLIPNTFSLNIGAKKFVNALAERYTLSQRDLSGLELFSAAHVRNIQLIIQEPGNAKVSGFKVIQKKLPPGQNKKTQHLSRVGDHFEVSQGLIPYDKYRGHTKVQIKKRVYHSSKREGAHWKKELKGKDVSTCSVAWGKENWIKYGDWLAAPRKPKFFKGPRLLVREITDAKTGGIFCGFTADEFYNTPSIINIIPKEHSKKSIANLKALSVLLSSSMFARYHLNSNPKAKKGLFPKILVNDVRNLPVPEGFLDLDLSALYDDVQKLAEEGWGRDAIVEVIDQELKEFRSIGVAA